MGCIITSPLAMKSLPPVVPVPVYLSYGHPSGPASVAPVPGHHPFLSGLGDRDCLSGFGEHFLIPNAVPGGTVSQDRVSHFSSK